MLWINPKQISKEESVPNLALEIEEARKLMCGGIKIKIGSAYPLEEEMSMEVKGRDLVAGLPKTVTITSEEIRESLQEPLRAILEVIKISL